jgi:hypothetical protein
MPLSSANCGTKIHQFTEGIDIEIKREGIREFANINRSFQVDKLKVQHDLRNVCWRESSSGELYKSRVLSTSKKVAAEHQALDTRCS